MRRDYGPVRWVGLPVILGVALLLAATQVARARQGQNAPAPLPPLQFTAADHGHPALSHVRVTAMAFAPDGTAYASGLYLAPNPQAAYGGPTVSPVIPTVSLWLVSHDHGRHWSARMGTTSPATLRGGLLTGPAAWRDHTRLPMDFAGDAITIDPRNPRILYVAGCTTTGLLRPTIGDFGGQLADHTANCMTVQDRLLLRSLDGGHSWQSMLRLSPTSTAVADMAYLTARELTTNITVTPQFLARLRGHPWPALVGYAIAVDPRDDHRIYACVDGIGLLVSINRGVTWQYPTQPAAMVPAIPGNALSLGPVHFADELLVDPRQPATIYDLVPASPVTPSNAKLFRSLDRGRTWREMTPSWGGTHTFVQGLTISGATLFAAINADSVPQVVPVAANGASLPAATLATRYDRYGLYASTDHGAHWYRVLVSPFGTGWLSRTVASRQGWISLVMSTNVADAVERSGIYVRSRGGAWRLEVQRFHLDRTGGRVDTLGTPASDPLFWDDRQAGVIFLARPTGGLYRWTSNV